MNLENMPIKAQLCCMAERVAAFAKSIMDYTTWLYAASPSSSEELDAWDIKFFNEKVGYLKRELKDLCNVLARMGAHNA